MFGDKDEDCNLLGAISTIEAQNTTYEIFNGGVATMVKKHVCIHRNSQNI